MTPPWPPTIWLVIQGTFDLKVLDCNWTPEAGSPLELFPALAVLLTQHQRPPYFPDIVITIYFYLCFYYCIQPPMENQHSCCVHLIRFIVLITLCFLLQQMEKFLSGWWFDSLGTGSAFMCFTKEILPFYLFLPVMEYCLHPQLTQKKGLEVFQNNIEVVLWKAQFY